MSEYLEFSKTKKCLHAQNCSGCFYFQDNLQLALIEQEKQKRSLVIQKLENDGWDLSQLPIQYLNPHPLHYRNHLDFTLDHGKIGLYMKKASLQEPSQILDIEECLVLNKDLQNFFQSIKPVLPSNKRGSIRLRNLDRKKFGVWLDFSNLDIKDFLETKTFLLSLLQKAHVEIGQRGKKLVADENGKLKLQDPEYHHWFSTRFKDIEIPLFSLVKSFTQSGTVNNHFMIQEIQHEFRQSFGHRKKAKALEMGSGIGNLTLPFLEFYDNITCLEWDQVSLTGLKLTVQEQSAAGNIHADQLTLIHGDFHQSHRHKMNLNQFEGLILNPARSGVGEFLDQLKENTSLQSIFLMSCYLDSFAEDAKRIRKAGFRCERIKIIDQFSFSSHFEILSFWSR